MPLSPISKHSWLEDFDALILCGGQSRRMGRDKSFLEVGQTHFLQLAKTTCIEAGISRIYTVGPARNDIDIVDEKPFQGPAVALVNALVQRASCINESDTVCVSSPFKQGTWLTRTKHVIVLPVDMPLLTPDVITPLIQQARLNQRSCHYKNECFPLVIYDVGEHLDTLAALVEEHTNLSMRAIISRIAAQALDFSNTTNECLTNINTPGEYAKLCTQMQDKQTQLLA